jgi:hypothetical protein
MMQASTRLAAGMGRADGEISTRSRAPDIFPDNIKRSAVAQSADIFGPKAHLGKCVQGFKVQRI